jgi:hypothetical protein
VSAATSPSTRVAVLVLDPDDGTRWIEIRGDAELVEDSAVGQLDRLTCQYTGSNRYFGTICPVEQREHETRVMVRLHPAPHHLRRDPRVRTRASG